MEEDYRVTREILQAQLSAVQEHPDDERAQVAIKELTPVIAILDAGTSRRVARPSDEDIINLALAKAEGRA